MRQSRRAGFTLVELLIVTAIIAVLLGLLMRGVQVARQSALQTKCASNMANIGLAYHNWKFQNGDKAFPVTGWISELCGPIGGPTGGSTNAQKLDLVHFYLENAKTTLRCPMDDFRAMSAIPSSTSGGGSTGTSGTTGSSWVPGATMYIALWRNNHTVPLHIPNYGGGNMIAIEKNGLRSRESHTYTTTAPGAWYAEFETTNGTDDVNQALDWNDLYLLIEPQSNGTNKVTFYAADGGAKDTNLVGGDETFDLLDANQNVVATNATNGSAAYIPVVPTDGSGVCSYGINQAADYVDRNSSKILMIEYVDSMVRYNPLPAANAPLSFKYKCPGYPTPRPTDPSIIIPNDRHKGTINVLFGDGHVVAMVPLDIAPMDANNAAIPANLTNFWNPQ